MTEYEKSDELQYTPQYISDEIGDDYLNWGKGDIILITAQTGTGKSSFVLRQLLVKAIVDGTKILYLVNRKVLMEQLRQILITEIETEILRTWDLDGPAPSLDCHIEFMTYQMIESGLKNGKLNDLLRYFNKFSYIVYDEAHYFYTDSNFNTYTELSFDCLRKEFDSKVQIFISATLREVATHIKRYPPVFLPFKNCEVNLELQLKRDRFHEYNTPINYDYIDLHIFDNMLEIRNIIEEKGVSSKWLIFVDSIEHGKEFKKQLSSENNIEEKNIMFIDADYKKNEEVEESVRELTKYKRISHRIVIATAVLDNGVSFEDNYLKNVVIMADSEETFIQMTGRKRMSKERMNLYICRRTRKHFLNRLQSVEKTLEFYRMFKNNVENIYARIFKQNECTRITPYTDLYHRTNVRLDDSTLTTQVICDYRGFIDYEFILQNQKVILDYIISHNEWYYRASKICYFVNGVIAINKFSIKRLQDLKVFYSDMVNKLESDENLFIKRQAAWLGISEDKINRIILESGEELQDKYVRELEQAINNVLDTLLTHEENIEWKLGLKDQLLYFLKKDIEYKGNEKEDIGKARPLSCKMFGRCVKQANLPFKMKLEKGEVKNQSEKEDKNKMLYKIVKIED